MAVNYIHNSNGYPEVGAAQVSKSNIQLLLELPRLCIADSIIIV